MTISQCLTLLVVVIAYAAFVFFQMTFRERRLRNLPWRAAIVRRIGWSIVHFFVGCVAFAVVGSYVNIWATGSYREGPSNRFGIFAAVIALSIPWLGLLWGRRGESK